MNLPEIIFLESNRVWRTYLGGVQLDKLEGKAVQADGHFPEDWIGSTTPAVNKGREHISYEGLSTTIIEGEKYSLLDLCKRFPEEVLGADHYARYGANIQFLVKFLDSSIRLHIQCHPTIEFAQKHLNSNSGKTEAYLILGIREGIKEPYIYAGFQNPPSKEELKQTIEKQDTTKLLSYYDKFPVSVGDVFIVPGGMPHAIGEGIFMIEIMEPTDFTVRIEFERGGYELPESSRFMDRGIDFSLSMFDFNPISIEKFKQQHFCSPRVKGQQNSSVEYTLINADDTDRFSASKIEVRDHYDKSIDSFSVCVITEGEGVVVVDGHAYDVAKGSRFVIPHKTESLTYRTNSSMDVLMVYPPQT